MPISKLEFIQNDDTGLLKVNYQIEELHWQWFHDFEIIGLGFVA